MYSRQDASKLKQEFWTAFGRYMQPVQSAEGSAVNWVNYRTGEKDITFRMSADNKKAVIAIELSHRDPGLRQLFFEQLLAFRQMFLELAGETWTWKQEERADDGRELSRVFAELEPVSIFKKEDWPALISFFKQRIMILDEFWSNIRHVFESLR